MACGFCVCLYTGPDVKGRRGRAHVVNSVPLRHRFLRCPEDLGVSGLDVPGGGNVGLQERAETCCRVAENIP